MTARTRVLALLLALIVAAALTTAVHAHRFAPLAFSRSPAAFEDAAATYPAALHAFAPFALLPAPHARAVRTMQARSAPRRRPPPGPPPSRTPLGSTTLSAPARRVRGSARAADVAAEITALLAHAERRGVRAEDVLEQLWEGEAFLDTRARRPLR